MKQKAPENQNGKITGLIYHLSHRYRITGKSGLSRIE